LSFQFGNKLISVHGVSHFDTLDAKQIDHRFEVLILHEIAQFFNRLHRIDLSIKLLSVACVLLHRWP
jgi:hypothetical protein